jgi:hypothetical protein
MSWYHSDREITEEDYKAIMDKKKSPRDFFSVSEIAGYGAIPSMPYEKDGKYFIPYGMSDSCD